MIQFDYWFLKRVETTTNQKNARKSRKQRFVPQTVFVPPQVRREIFEPSKPYEITT